MGLRNVLYYMEKLSFKIKPKEPFRLDLTVWALRRRSNNVIDLWYRDRWKRVFIVGDEPIETTVVQKIEKDATILVVNLVGLRLETQVKKEAKNVIEKCLGTNIDLSDFYNIAFKDDKLKLLVSRFCGFKPPRFPTIFEAAVNGIACQQVSLNVGITLLNRLAMNYGRTFQSENAISYAFPIPEDLSKLKPEDFRKFGFSCQKGRAIIELAQTILAGKTDFKQFMMLEDEDALNRLFQLRGIGTWTGEYILLRGLGRLNVFPTGDAGGRRGLQRWLNLPDKLSYDEAKTIAAKWKPYSGLVYFHLLLNRLHQEGCLSEVPVTGNQYKVKNHS